MKKKKKIVSKKEKKALLSKDDKKMILTTLLYSLLNASIICLLLYLLSKYNAEFDEIAKEMVAELPIGRIISLLFPLLFCMTYVTSSIFIGLTLLFAGKDKNK